MYKMTVTGRNILWPALCACCCREADTSVDLVKAVEDVSYNWFTRTTTTRTESRTWSIPYCRTCLEHIHADRARREFLPTDTHPSCLLAGVLGVGLIIALALMVTIQPPLTRHLSMGGAAVGVLLLIVISYPMCSDRFRRTLEANESRRLKLLANVEELSCPTCCDRGHLAVRFEGWKTKSHGEWQEDHNVFNFTSPLYAELFLEANAGNCKPDGPSSFPRLESDGGTE